MADMFIKIDGIAGESQDATHPEEIEVLNWSWAVSQQSGMHSGSGGGAAKASVTDLRFVHHIDIQEMNQIMVCIGEYIDATVEAELNHSETHVICEIDYVDVGVPRALALSEVLDRQFGIDLIEKNYRLDSGYFSMTLDSRKRIKDWDIYTNPNQWIRGERELEESVPATVYFDAEFDEDGRIDAKEPTEFHDPVRGTFYLSWGEASTWYAIAPNLAIGAASDGTLAEIRLTGIHAQPAQPATKQQAEGVWRRLRRRFGL